ncbi:MAG: LuxR family transcriptional regulator [Micromonosporaceae bacterium]|jgi:DNA-binding CsgD family transcriptional regulator|nr:LuxR family transcriptional regulator [Micromonosporaceae bacterium]
MPLSLPTATRPELLLDDQAAPLLDAASTDPLTPLAVGIVAPGGHGKSTLLEAVRQEYLRAGVPVIGMAQAMARRTDGGAVLLVDDAHLLPDPQLVRLRELAEARSLPLVAAYRPLPRPALAELGGALGRSWPLVALGPFDAAQVAARLGSALGCPPPAELAESVCAYTGGVPRFVAWVAAALAGTGETTVDGAAAQLPPFAVAQFRSDWERMEPALRQLLVATQAGMGLQLELLGALLGRDPDGLAELSAAARATGLLDQAGALLPVAERAIATLTPAEHRVDVLRRLAELRRERGGAVLPLARPLLGTGLVGPGIAATFEAAAAEALPEQPATAAQLYAAAVEAGRPVAAVRARWAHAAALAGDLDLALRLADQVIAAPDGASTGILSAAEDPGHAGPAGAAGRSGGARPGELRGGALVAATALAHRGQLARSAELLRWAGGPCGVLATVGLIGTGQLSDAQRLLEAPPGDSPPTLLAGAAPLMARGVHESVVGSATGALATLVRACALLEPAGRAVLLPDSPAALTALVGLHCGELRIADSVLSRAIAAGLGGDLMSARHRLLRAWIAMARGDTAAATETLAAVTGAATHMEPRDWVFAVGLEVGLARRSSDLPTLRRAWAHACEAMLRHPVDLFTLLPLGEFAVAAARLGDQDRLEPHLVQAREMLHRLGDPPLWAAMLHWSGLHAAILAAQPGGAATSRRPPAARPAQAGEHAAALARIAAHNRTCAALASAAECWLAVLAGRVDPAAVEAAARGLHEAGLGWDGARLAGQAAIRTTDRKAMVALLECARQLQGRGAGSRPAGGSPGDPPAGRPGATQRPVCRLSEREQEVAELVLAGMTYRQIGDRLFISAKTVEHHVARIRQRLGCTGRSDLLARLRELAAERG